jgi:hypothetical protein
VHVFGVDEPSRRIAVASAASARAWQTARILSVAAPARSETTFVPPLAGGVTNIEARKGMMREAYES